MKSILVLIIFTFSNWNYQQSETKLSAFEKVPDDISGCGNAYYLTQKDKKLSRLICWTDLTIAYIYINGKPTRLKNIKSRGKEMEFNISDYTLFINNSPLKQIDDEYYIMKATITLKKGKQVVWRKQVVGDGGC
ncbi:MAG: hypothetical protein V4520_01905 [Bacteroidota bacterium]